MSDSAAAAPGSAASAAPGLTASQLEQFDRDGYLILSDFFSSSDADALKSRIDELIAQLDLATHPRTIFRTKVDGAQTASTMHQSEYDDNRYFLDSADKVHYFFEEHAFDPTGQLVVDKERAINKVGHQLHTQEPLFRDFTYRPAVKALAHSIGFKQACVLQSMAILKNPRIGGVVNPHRDSTFLYTRPSTATGLWFALEDCTTDNGCLEFVPGSHKDGASTKRFGRQASEVAPLRATVNNDDFDATSTDTAKHSGPCNARVELGFTGEDTAVYPAEKWVSAEVKKGTLVLIHGDVVHASTHNHSDKSRYIYTCHLIERDGTTYPKENWLQSAEEFPKLE